MLDGQYVASSSHTLSFQRLLTYYVFQVNIAFLLFELIAFASISGGNRLVYRSCHVTYIKRICSAMYPLQRCRRITFRKLNSSKCGNESQPKVPFISQYKYYPRGKNPFISSKPIVASLIHCLSMNRFSPHKSIFQEKTFGSNQIRHDTVCHFLLLVLQTIEIVTLFTRPIEPFDGKREP